MSDHQELLNDYEATKPEDTDFRQQRLRAWQPLLIPKYVIITFIILGCIFLPVGFAIWDGSSGVVEVEQRYDNLPCVAPSPAPCLKTFEIAISETIPRPVYVYYKLTNFFQNHRRYVKSRADMQLSGDISASTTTCDPLEDWNEKTIYPCGLIANSHFNDTFSAAIQPNGSDVPTPLTEWTEKGISWAIDRNKKFVDKYPGTDPLPDDLTREGPNGELPHIDNEHFMNWMRTSAFPTFRKLYAFINRELITGDKLFLTVEDNFNTLQFEGTKSIVIANATWIGGRNFILAYLYIGVGAFCFVMALLVFLKQCICPRKLGSMATAVDLRKVQRTD